MRKYKATILTIQVFCIMLLIMSGYLERGVSQVAYCFTAFSSPFLILAFGEDAFLYEKISWSAAGIVVIEALMSALFIGAMVIGMKMDPAALHGFSTLLAVYVLAAALSVVERFTTGGRAHQRQM